MVQTDMWRIADEQLHGAGYKTLVCHPENALTGAGAQLEGLIAVPFAHVLRRAFSWYSSTDSAGGDQVRLFKAIVGGTFAVIAGTTQNFASASNVSVINLPDVAVGTLPQEEESSDTGALYRMELDLIVGGDTANDFGFGIMVSVIPPGGFQGQQ